MIHMISDYIGLAMFPLSIFLYMYIRYVDSGKRSESRYVDTLGRRITALERRVFHLEAARKYDAGIRTLKERG